MTPTPTVKLRMVTGVTHTVTACAEVRALVKDRSSVDSEGHGTGGAEASGFGRTTRHSRFLVGARSAHPRSGSTMMFEGTR